MEDTIDLLLVVGHDLNFDFIHLATRIARNDVHETHVGTVPQAHDLAWHHAEETIYFGFGEVGAVDVDIL